jgi:long-chain acyl-CoA synthetase
VNLASVVLSERAGESPALTASETTLSYEELTAAAAQAAGGLSRIGVAPGDRVAIVASNTPAFVRAYLATLWAGAIAVPVDPRSGAGELGRRLAYVDARAAVVDVTGRDAFVAASAHSEVATVVAVGDEMEGAEPWDALAQSDPVPMVERDDSDVAVLLFTAGTVDRPKAAMLTHGNLVAGIRQVLDHPGLSLRESDIALGALPLCHVFGLHVMLGVTLAAGAQLVLVEEFHAAASASLVSQRRVTVLAAVPAMYEAWLADSDAPGDAFASVRLAVSGAAPLPPETAEAFASRFGVVVHEGYGLTESPIVTTAAVAGEPHPGSIGPPLPGVEVRLVDVDGTDVLPGDPGEIWVHGPGVFAGYWNAPEATNAVLTEGWLRTGDVAVSDDSGWLSIVDRAKDLVIVSGFNVFPAEVEEVLLAHPDVAEAAALGEPDARTGERLVAFVVPAPGHRPDPAALTAWTARHLARYKCPARIEVVDELPRSFVGKLLRRELRTSD